MSIGGITTTGAQYSKTWEKSALLRICDISQNTKKIPSTQTFQKNAEVSLLAIFSIMNDFTIYFLFFAFFCCCMISRILLLSLLQYYPLPHFQGTVRFGDRTAKERCTEDESLSLKIASDGSLLPEDPSVAHFLSFRYNAPWILLLMLCPLCFDVNQY